MCSSDLEDFMFRLSNSEIDSVRSQIVTSRKKDFFAGQEGGRRYLPYAFTEQGIYMLATVLRGKLAEQQSIFICLLYTSSFENRSTFPPQTGENGSRKDDFGRYRIYRRRNAVSYTHLV